MPHGLDHIVHAVRDLDAAAAFYASAGFTVGARNRHPWGTHNRIVQLKNCYIEMLEVVEPDKIVPHGARSFSFGAFNRDFLAAREGFSMLLLNSSNAADDARAFEAAGIGNSKVFDFAREGKKPDGTVVKLAFSLAFAQDKASPNVRFAACQHHFPENFWNPAFQIHANGARAVSGAVMVADNPTDHHIFLKAFTGLRDLHSTSIGIQARTENGVVEITEPVSFRDQFDVSSEVSGEGMTLNALRFVVADLAQTETLHRQNKIASRRHVGRLVVPPDVAHRATLIFEAAKEG
ncbi:VOC family protein [Bradyrhizobium canariense]|uniref:Glyoxalase-like domain-containing protein n=1 Tax=Bradyrhizobium canariense TaxID=255045 RepID=A0A1H1PTT3_9BRAD|nr:VOC family protein [Bradyrhizobium canariense]SDS14672.1 Glyoxalase-like domain-containing protein [Bradyrhizobium canariense]